MDLLEVPHKQSPEGEVQWLIDPRSDSSFTLRVVLSPQELEKVKATDNEIAFRCDLAFKPFNAGTMVEVSSSMFFMTR